MVPGHTVFTGTDLTRVGDEESWYLESYQKGQLSTFIAHIREAVHIADADPHSLLIFSGGQTRLPAGPRTEAQSYYTAAQTSNWFNPTHSTPTSLSLRATTEEHARDSFENVLFSIARFREYTGRYPERITVVGFGFKKMRFVDLHRGALRWPVEKYEYVSVDPPSGLEKAMEGEMQNSVKHFREDLYGCRGTLLEKKLSRDPFARTVPYLLSCPEMRELLAYCPQDNSVFPGMLPWSSQ
ncbi:hypothetical protein HK102_011322 [Quaeritorhiza haematococci]|nr:hypothetical protein HK102_011322 [Quaeritorhiza haematococci]